MAKKIKLADERRTTASVSRIYTALLYSDGTVVKGTELIEQQSVLERQAGRDVVVCGDDADANSELAKRIENAANGDYVRHGKHRPLGLNHYQPLSRPPAGHTFYETKGSKARKR